VQSLLKTCFITGTDTGVGKTTVTAGVAAVLRKRRINVGVMKPISAGKLQKSGFKSADVELLSKAANTSDPADLINPVFLQLEASPYDASKILQTPIDMPLILSNFKKLKSLHDILLIEGIGGLMTPITRKFYVADMIKAMGAPTIIVSRTLLGTINHTVMTCRICKDYGIPLKGIIINNLDNTEEDITKKLAETIFELTSIDILGTISNIKDYSLENISKQIELDLDLKLFIT